MPPPPLPAGGSGACLVSTLSSIRGWLGSSRNGTSATAISARGPDGAGAGRSILMELPSPSATASAMAFLALSASISVFRLVQAQTRETS